MAANLPIGLTVGLIVLTMPMAGCLSATEQLSEDDVATLHVHHRFEDGRGIGYAIELSSPAGVDLVDLTLDALSQAEGPLNVSEDDPPPHITVNLTVDLTFEETQEVQGIGEVRMIKLAVTNGTPNLLVKDDGEFYGTFYHASVDVGSLEQAAERALDQIRAENGGELPRERVTVERPPDNSTGQNETSDNRSSDAE